MWDRLFGTFQATPEPAMNPSSGARSHPRHNDRDNHLQEGRRLVERQTREPRVQHRGIAVPEITEEIRLRVPFRDEFLIAAKTGLPGRKELLVQLHVIKAGHRPAIDAERPPSYD